MALIVTLTNIYIILYYMQWCILKIIFSQYVCKQWRRFRVASGGRGGRNRPSSFGHSSGERKLATVSIASFLVWGGGQAPKCTDIKNKSYTCNLYARASASETYRPLFSHMVWRYKRQYRTKHCHWENLWINYASERGASERGNFSHFHILKVLFPSIFCWYSSDTLSQKHIYFQVSNYIFIYIQSMQFPVITYGMALYIKDSYVYRQNTNIEKIYVYASERA